LKMVSQNAHPRQITGFWFIVIIRNCRSLAQVRLNVSRHIGRAKAVTQA
jgi:hypothetical protein